MPGRWLIDPPSGDDVDDFAAAEAVAGAALVGDGGGKKRGESFVFVDEEEDSDDGNGEGGDRVSDAAYVSMSAMQTSTVSPTMSSSFEPECWNGIKGDVWIETATGAAYGTDRPLPLRNTIPTPSGSPGMWNWSGGNANGPVFGFVDEQTTNARKRRRTTSNTNHTVQSEQQVQASPWESEYINFDSEGMVDDVTQPRLENYSPVVRAASNVPPQIGKSSNGLTQHSCKINRNAPGSNYVSLSEALLERPRNPTSRNRLLSTSSHAYANDSELINSFLSTDQPESIDVDVPQDSPSPYPIPSPFATTTPASTTTPNHNSHLQHGHRKRKSSLALSLSPSPSPSSPYTKTTPSATYPFSLSLSSQISPFTHPHTGLSLVMGYNTALPKSRLDMYITAMRQLALAAKTAGVAPLRHETQRAITAEGVLWAVREAWPAAEGYWNMTATFRGFLAAEQYRNFPSPRTYAALPPAYRPTRAQLAVPHSPMIDWLPWPDVRDLAIRYQDEIDLDALFRVAIHNVVAHRKGRGRRVGRGLLEGGICSGEVEQGQNQVHDGGGEEDTTSFRVWDLVCLEKANGTDPLASPGLDKKPVPRSPGVRAVLRAYDLEYDDFDTQKLDDGFWEAFPALYCETAASSWRVQRLEGSGMGVGLGTGMGMGVGTVDVGRPVALRGQMVRRLKGKIEGVVGTEIVV